MKIGPVSAAIALFLFSSGSALRANAADKVTQSVAANVITVAKLPTATPPEQKSAAILAGVGDCAATKDSAASESQAANSKTDTELMPKAVNAPSIKMANAESSDSNSAGDESGDTPASENEASEKLAKDKFQLSIDTRATDAEAGAPVCKTE